MNVTTVIYYTDNTLPADIEALCQRQLFRAARGKRIISVSQKPMAFGRNICMGDIGRSHHSLFTQALTGAIAAKTRYIALAEHDVLYPPCHLDWLPVDDGIFWYNVNNWYADWRTGEYSYYRRRPMSTLVCNRDLFIEAIREKILMLERGFEIRPGQPGACEPGVCDNRKAFRAAYQSWWEQFDDVGKRDGYRAKGFATDVPVLDIRHGGNFSGRRRGGQRRYELPYWGRFEDVISGDVR